MKILFVACYVDNSYFIPISKQTLDKYLLNCTYEYVCLNDSPDVKAGEENYLNICDIESGEESYQKILDSANACNFTHIKIPQSLHVKVRPNHGGPRHIENLNWFNSNIDTLYPSYKDFDFICHIDSDGFFCKPVDLSKELNGYDMAGPFIYLGPKYYIHTGLFFININTVKNMKDIKWDNTCNTDTGSDILNFIDNNPQYKIKKLGHYDGYSTNNWIENKHTNLKLDIPDMEDEEYKMIDVWFENKFVHFRGGSCFGVGSKLHRVDKRLALYNAKYDAFMKLVLGE